MSLGEIVLLLLVGIIVVGPRNLPTMMRTAGQWVARLRRMTTDLRSQSGIDDILRKEGLDEHLHQLRSLSRLNVVESLIAPVAAHTPGGASPYPAPSAGTFPQAGPQMDWKRTEPLREREYPLIGCDAGGALPDDAVTYRNPLPDRTPPAVEPPAPASEPVTMGETPIPPAQPVSSPPPAPTPIPPAQPVSSPPPAPTPAQPADAAPDAANNPAEGATS